MALLGYEIHSITLVKHHRIAYVEYETKSLAPHVVVLANRRSLGIVVPPPDPLLALSDALALDATLDLTSPCQPFMLIFVQSFPSHLNHIAEP